MRILVTGASGFIGSFIVEEALNRGFDTWAAVRSSSSRRYLGDSRINFIELDFDNEEKLTHQLRDHQFDYIVHAAGVTKCLHRDDFYMVNTGFTETLAHAILSSGISLKKFVYLSSLSVFGAVREQQPYTEITDNDSPRPNTHYGRSKMMAEQLLDKLKDKLPLVVLRPTGVYGPRERDYFMMAKSIKQHTDFSVGYKRQDITFVYVTDVVEAVFLAMENGQSGRRYFLTDGEVYSSRTFSDYLHEELGNPWWIRMTAPVWMLRIITTLGELWGRITGTITALNNDKYHILKQRNWRCNIEPARRELGYNPKVRLKEGVRLSVEWYKKNGWL